MHWLATELFKMMGQLKENALMGLHSVASESEESETVFMKSFTNIALISTLNQ